MGKRPPTIRAKTVIASAPRRTGARQVAFVSRRIAEMSVPEWETPIQKTKRMIMTPQKTGRPSPVTPIPVSIMYTKAPTPHRNTASRSAVPMYHQRLVGRLERESSR